MKIASACLMAMAVWLAGCATTGSAPAPEAVVAAAPTGSSAGDTPAPVASKPTAPAPVTPPPPAVAPVFPAGTLTPITAVQASRLGVMQLSPPADLWERIRRGYAMPNFDSELVRDREQWYATRPDYIFRMTERSRKYLFHIVEELERRNMPTELALLPFVESAFNPQAVSGAKAAGMWQFMPATGKNFELKQNAFRDDRRDVLASTRAALDYLQKLYGMFGDWHLALAAYNWGEGSVGRAIAKNQKAGMATGYPDLNMPMETRFYVPKLQAIKNIVSTPDAFNSKLPLIENHPFFDTVTIKRDIDVALAAKLANVSLDDFKALNPSASRPVILAAGTPQILLPWDNAAVFQSNLESYGSARLSSWTVWIAPTTLKPADAARRVGMTESELRAVNNIPPRVVIKAGSSLLVPRGDRTHEDVAVHVADNGQIGLAPEVVTRRTVVKAGKNESVASVARRYQVTAGNVAEWNKLSVNSILKAGQQVVLFLPARARVSARAPAARGAGARTAAKPAKRPAARSVRPIRR
jgi:membrane-bound lytic murein transglycosylase D